MHHPVSSDHDTRSPSRPRLLRSPVRSLMVALALLLAFTAGYGADRLTTESGVGALQNHTAFQDVENYQTLEETYDAIRANYVLSEEISDEELIWGASRGMVDALGDEGHSVFLDPEEAENYEASLQGELTGIGINVDTTSTPPMVIAPIDGSPAFEAGIQSGDLILEVDGESTDTMDPIEVTDLIRGEAGTDVTLTLQSVDDPEPYTVTITRADIEIDPVSWAMLPDDVLWIRISNFSRGATEGVREALAEGAEQGAEQVILDLRRNPGGFVIEAIGVGSQFLANNTVLYQEEDADGNVREITTQGSGGWQEGPLAVLVDQYSASASEIVSSSIKDNERGEVIGETTIGTGTVLQPVGLSDGSQVNIGVALWLTPDGDVIWMQGVDPTIEVVNEVGVNPALPFQFDDQMVSEEELSGLEDDQLLVAIDEVTEEEAPE